MNKRIKRILHNPYRVLWFFFQITKIELILNDKLYLKLVYRCIFDKKLDLNNPKTYNEQINWLKLYDRNPLYHKLVDKYEAKIYAQEIIGEEYIIPTFGVWDNYEEIDFDQLPQQFVLKCTHDSGSTIVCKNKASFDHSAAKKKLKKALKKNLYLPGREWVYKGVKPRILAEKFMSDDKSESIFDYKFFCYYGEPKFLFVATDRHLGNDLVKFDFFDLEFNHLDIIQLHDQNENSIPKPACFEEMIQLSRKLSKGIPHVRIDLYDIKGNPYFGEFTFYHHGGTIPFRTKEWDSIIGSWFTVPKKYNKR